MGKPDISCDCGSKIAYAACCGRFHVGLALGIVAPDAESLMRSRYSAYVRRLEPYLLATWHDSTRPSALNLMEEPTPKWLGLEVKRAEECDDSAVVEFVARCRIGGRAQRMHERSQFVRMEGRWYYLSGEIN